MTYTGNFGAEEPKEDILGASDNGIKVKVQLMNIFHSTNDENICPEGPKKRIIHVKEDAPIGKNFTPLQDYGGIPAKMSILTSF